MRRLVGGLVFALVLGGASLSGAQEPPACRWEPQPDMLRNGMLFGVDAVDPSNAWAVGSVRGHNFAGTLVQHWDGTSWERQPSPSVKEQTNELDDVVQAADGTVWAVGYRSRAVMKTIVQRYDGTRWRMQRSLNPSKTLNVLEGVDVTPGGTVFAAGSRWNRNRRYRTMIHRFDGATWQLVPGTQPGMLHDIDLVSDTDGWAVGMTIVDRVGRSHALRFDGEEWNPVELPSVGNGFNTLDGVSAASPNDVWAVGAYSEGNRARPLILHFDGTTWSVQEVQGVEGDVTLFSVSALDADTAVAVGQRNGYDYGEDSRVVLEWDGTSWTEVVRDEDLESNWLYAVDVTTDGSAWAVGYHSTTPSTAYVDRRTCS